MTNASNSERTPEMAAAVNRFRAKAHRPDTAGMLSPLYAWPPQPKALFKFFFGFPGFLFPFPVVMASVALVKWFLLYPDLSQSSTLSAGWILKLYLQNVVLIITWVSSLHLWLYVRRGQGMKFKFNPQWLSRGDRTFLFKVQLWDNVFWNIFSAVVVWTAYEAVFLWMYSNNILSPLEMGAHPIYTVLLFVVLPFWQGAHFYFVHRFMHFKMVYRIMHFVHHKNINPGPWSGLAMDPLEVILFFSPMLVLLVIPAHPIHAIYLLLVLALFPAVGHAGFERVELGGFGYIFLGDYMHNLHHKYVTVNYGAELVPFDRIFGTAFDGSKDAMRDLASRGRIKAANRGNAEVDDRAI